MVGGQEESLLGWFKHLLKVHSLGLLILVGPPMLELTSTCKYTRWDSSLPHDGLTPVHE